MGLLQQNVEATEDLMLPATEAWLSEQWQKNHIPLLQKIPEDFARQWKLRMTPKRKRISGTCFQQWPSGYSDWFLTDFDTLPSWMRFGDIEGSWTGHIRPEDIKCLPTWAGWIQLMCKGPLRKCHLRAYHGMSLQCQSFEKVKITIGGPGQGECGPRTDPAHVDVTATNFSLKDLDNIYFQAPGGYKDQVITMAVYNTPLEKKIQEIFGTMKWPDERLLNREPAYNLSLYIHGNVHTAIWFKFNSLAGRDSYLQVGENWAGHFTLKIFEDNLPF